MSIYFNVLKEEMKTFLKLDNSVAVAAEFYCIIA